MHVYKSNISYTNKIVITTCRYLHSYLVNTESTIPFPSGATRKAWAHYSYNCYKILFFKSPLFPIETVSPT